MTNLKAKVASLSVRHAAASVAAEREADALAKAERPLACREKARTILQELAQQLQRSAHERIAAVASRCLEAVFDQPYQLQIRWEKLRGKTEARLAFVRNGKEVDPLGASGGGPVAVSGFALRLAELILSRPPKRRLLLLDEPFTHIAKDLRPKVAKLLELVASELEVQIVMVTHEEELVAGKAIRL